ncbi:MAG: alpha/beta fold hydrolase [Phycisphaerae bacterium]|nr:alpha/beta fold hydrolase [Phycisphaerae bacterium]
MCESDDPDSQLLIAHVSTRDAARIAIKRKPAPGGTPVIFLHGLAVNADLWDLPDVRGAGYAYRSLAKVLHETGYDIWLVNLRGHGAPRMLSEPPPGQTDWCVDHFILYDLPAVVDHVAAETGLRPFVIGASMGSMTLAGYVQGARLVGAGAEAHLEAEPETARARQEKLAGCVFVELPAKLRWPDSLYDQDGRLQWRVLLRDWWRSDEEVNHSFEMLSRWGWLQALLAAVGEVPLTWLGGEDEDQPWYRKLPKSLADGVAQVERAVMQAMLQMVGTFTGESNHRAEVLLHGRRYIMDHMKAGVLKQMAKCVREGVFVSALGSPDHVYSDHYELVELPTLVLHGGRDRIANADVTRTAFFERIRSADKEFLLYEDLAHGEIEAAPGSCRRIFPTIVAWLNARNRPQS